MVTKRDNLGRFVGEGKKEFCCLICSKKFLDYDSAKRKFCSNECYNNWMKINCLGEKNPFFGKHHTEEVKERLSVLESINPRVKKKCKLCGKELKKIRGQTWKRFSKKDFCSHSCSSKYFAPYTSPFMKIDFVPWNKNKKGVIVSHRKGLTFEEEYGEEKARIIKMKSKGKTKSKEIIDKIKMARAKQILPIKDTKIELKIQNFLKQLGIEFFTHQYIKIEHGYQCDILVPSMNLVIECDGDYWHKYPIGTDIDHIRTKELLEKGFKVLRLWEFEINDITIKEFENIINGGKLK